MTTRRPTTTSMRSRSTARSTTARRIVKAHVQPPRLPRPRARCRASTRSTGPASWRRSSTTSPRRSRSARRTARSSFTVPTGNFGDIYAGYVAKRMGLPIERLVIATNGNDILARTLRHRHATRLRGVVADRPRRRWTSRCRRISSACCSSAYGRDGKAVARADGRRWRSRGASPSPPMRARRHPHAVRGRTAPTRRRPPRPSARCCGDRLSRSIRTPRSASRWPRRTSAIRRCRWWCCRPRIRRSSRMRSKPPAACARHLPEWLADLNERTERMTRLPAEQHSVEQFILAASSRRA